MGRDQYKRKQPTKIQEKRARIKTTESIRNLMNINIRAARSEIIAYTEENPTDMFAVFLRGHIEEQLGNLLEAEKQYQKVAHSESNNKYSAIIRLGDIARKLGQTSKARAYYLKAIAESPNEEIYAIHTLAKLERINKNYEEALRILKLVKKLDEKTKIEMVKTLSLQGKIQEARTLLKTIRPTTSIERKDVELETGKIARREGNLSKARLHFSTIIDLGIKDETYCKAMHEMSLIELEEKEYEACLARCEELIGLAQEFDKDVYLTKGIAHQELGHYVQAIKDYKEASASTDFDVRSSAYYYLGNLQFASDDLEQAAISFLKSMEGDRIPPNSANAKLIGVYIRQGKYQEAEEFIETLKRKSSSTYDDSGISLARVIIAKKIGREIPIRKERTYSEGQIIAYDREAAIDHIKRHHASNKGTKSNFSSLVNIDELFDEIKLQMVDRTQVNADIMDIYEIDYPNAGYDREDNLVHRIRVVTAPGTLNIITMYPSGKTGTPRKCDIKDQLAETKTAPNSRISKFNARFARFNKQ